MIRLRRNLLQAPRACAAFGGALHGPGEAFLASYTDQANKKLDGLTTVQMLALHEILEEWRHQKVNRHFYRLKAALAVSFEFRGLQWGHPSNYASVQITAEPADDLEIALLADLPATLDVEYRGKLEAAVSMAAVDEFLASQWVPLRGCRLVVREVGWDDVMSSEVAIYNAARGALMKLRQEGSWELVTKQ